MYAKVTTPLRIVQAVLAVIVLGLAIGVLQSQPSDHTARVIHRPQPIVAPGIRHPVQGSRVPGTNPSVRHPNQQLPGVNPAIPNRRVIPRQFTDPAQLHPSASSVPRVVPHRRPIGQPRQRPVIPPIDPNRPHRPRPVTPPASQPIPQPNPIPTPTFAFLAFSSTATAVLSLYTLLLLPLIQQTQLSLPLPLSTTTSPLSTLNLKAPKHILALDALSTLFNLAAWIATASFSASRSLRDHPAHHLAAGAAGVGCLVWLLGATVLGAGLLELRAARRDGQAESSGAQTGTEMGMETGEVVRCVRVVKGGVRVVDVASSSSSSSSVSSSASSSLSSGAGAAAVDAAVDGAGAGNGDATTEPRSAGGAGADAGAGAGAGVGADGRGRGNSVLSDLSSSSSLSSSSLSTSSLEKEKEGEEDEGVNSKWDEEVSMAV